MNSSLHFFIVPALTPQAAQAELNAFLQQNRVVHVEKQWVADAAASFWSLCVTVVDGPGPLPANLRAPGQGARGGGGTAGGGKIDYREVLNEADFTVFAELRNLRASIAQAEGVPPYALFSNEQLASMVRQRVATAEQLRAIDGVGEARVAKYAERFLALKPGAHIGPSAQGVRYCGFRVRQGVVLASARKLSRYRRHSAGIDLAAHGGASSDADIQRASDAAHAALAHTQTLGFRRRLWAERQGV